MNSRFPIYVISKGRWESRLTAKALEKMRQPYRIVIEPQEYDQYSSVIDPKKILVLPFSNLGQGSIPARNWVWEHSMSGGHEWHWILDDNIKNFRRIHQNRATIMADGTCFYVCEEFVLRYQNVALAGMEYDMFVNNRVAKKPFRVNARIYSCILIRNDTGFRWRGRYNEDTDLSIRVMKEKWCTLLFHIFTCTKTATMTMKGGNTDQLYKKTESFDGRLEMAKHLQRQHPDIVKVVWKFGRWQHSVDYSEFRKNKLRRKPNLEIPKGVDNFGMKYKPKK